MSLLVWMGVFYYHLPLFKRIDNFLERNTSLLLQAVIFLLIPTIYVLVLYHTKLYVQCQYISGLCR